MAPLPPSPFSSAGAGASAETLVVAVGPQAHAAASSHLSDSGVPSAFPPDEAAALDRPQGPGAAAEYDSLMDDICEIFAGARKLFDPDPAAYTNADQVLYDLLLQMDDPHAPDLIEMPYGMEGIFDPPPLFLQQQMRA